MVVGIVILVFAMFTGGIFAAVGTGLKENVKSIQADVDEFKLNAIETEGLITEAYDGNTVVSYETEDGSEYECSFNMYSSNMREGTRLTVYYQEDNPSNCAVPELSIGIYTLLSKIFQWVGIGIGAFFGVFGLIFVVAGIVVRKKNQPTYEN